MKRLCVLFGIINIIAATDSHSPLDTMQELGSALEEVDYDYDSDTEYAKHQYVHERFFRRMTQNPSVRKVIDTFKAEVAKKGQLTPINLDGMSSRTRIILIRELIAAANGQTLTIPFQLNNNQFNIKLEPTNDQPGAGIMSKIGTYRDEVYPVIFSYKEKVQSRFAKKLSTARRAPDDEHEEFELDYHPAILHPKLSEGGKDVDLEMLDILLDFEVARRLIGDRQEEANCHAVTTNTSNALTSPIKGSKTQYAVAFDSVPVGSALVGILKLSQLPIDDENFIPLESFFLANKKLKIKDWTFPYGDYNAFEGSANHGHREKATKRIIRKLRGGDRAKPSTKEDIHREYLEIFGGASESEGESYDTPQEISPVKVKKKKPTKK
jgi:hypothetical protein